MCESDPGLLNTGNLKFVQLNLNHTKTDSTVRYLGVDLKDTLEISEGDEI